jgi:hypothetical protein
MNGVTTRLSPIEVRKAVDRIVSSAEFRTSKRCQEFLRFVVEQSLDGRQPRVKERTIGIAVFGRDPGYDTHDDAIVRVKANEIRKKLALYYGGEGAGEALRIDIPAGSYIAEFSAPHEAPAPPAPAPAIPRRRSLSRWIFGVAALPLVAAGVFLALRHSGSTTLDRFWAPALESPRPVVICIGHPVVYLLSRRVHEAYQATRKIDPRQGPYVIQLDPDQPIPGRDVVPVADQFVGSGGAPG